MAVSATSFPASITSLVNYLPSGYPVQWSTGDLALLTHAQSCWTTYTEWRSYSRSLNAYLASVDASSEIAYVNITTSYYVATSTTQYPTTSVSTYTLCDGTPRANISPYTAVFSQKNVFVRQTLTTLSPSFAPNPCAPNADDCAIYYFQSNLGYFNVSTDTLQSLEAACGLPVDWPSPCVIQGGPAQLIYFPVPASTDDLCQAARPAPLLQSRTDAGTSIPTAVTSNGQTFSVGSAYISFNTLYAGYRSANAPGGQGIQVGPTFTNKIFEFRSDEISTNCFGTINPTQTTTAGYGLGTQLNFADLNSPVPASAYACQNQCQPCTRYLDSMDQIQTYCTPGNPCATIWNNFNPLLAVPTRFREIVPEWSSCVFWDDRIANLVFDPPSALLEFGTAESASLPTWFSPTKASVPASVPATPTALPDATGESRTFYVSSGLTVAITPWTTVDLAAPTGPQDTSIRSFIVGKHIYSATPISVSAMEGYVIESSTCLAGASIVLPEGVAISVSAAVAKTMTPTGSTTPTRTPAPTTSAGLMPSATAASGTTKSATTTSSGARLSNPCRLIWWSAFCTMTLLMMNT